ncbi:MAG: MATE family efflux transporter [Bacteroidota bacterium]
MPPPEPIPPVDPITPVDKLAAKPSLFRLLRESLDGHERDYTKLPVGRGLLLLSVPMVIEMIMEGVFEIADMLFVARLGVEAVVSAGLTGNLLVLVFTVAMGLSMAATAVVARRIGEKDEDGAARAAVQAIGLGVVVAVPFAVAGYVYAADLLRIMGGTPEVVAVGTTYCAWIFASTPIIVLLFLINAIFRGAGDASRAMYALGLANALNIVLDPLLIFGIGPFPELGLEGAAIATIIGRGTGVLFQIGLLIRGVGRLKIRRHHLQVELPVLKTLGRISGPGIVQFFVGSASWIILMAMITRIDVVAAAGYIIAIRVIVFALLPSWGMGNAAATLVGQNLGAGEPDRAERSAWLAGRVNMVVLVLFGIASWLGADVILRAFTDDPGAIRFGRLCLQIVTLSYPAFAYGMIVQQAFNGAGDTRTPTAINLISYWLLQLPLAYLLAQWYGAVGVFVAITIAQLVLAVLGITWFRQGKWKRVQV